MQWQKGWTFACVVNLVLHWVSATINAIAIYFMIPSAIASSASLCELTLNQCIATLMNPQERSSDVRSFSAPDFYFVSTRVARAFPDLLESALVLSYRSPTLPSEQSSRWTGHSSFSPSYRTAQTVAFGSISFGLSVFATYFIVFIGSQSIPVQSLILSAINPIIYGAVSLFCLNIIHNPWSGIGLFAGVVLLLAYMFGSRVRPIRFSFENEGNTAPLQHAPQKKRTKRDPGSINALEDNLDSKSGLKIHPIVEVGHHWEENSRLKVLIDESSHQYREDDHSVDQAIAFNVNVNVDVPAEGMADDDWICEISDDEPCAELPPVTVNIHHFPPSQGGAARGDPGGENVTSLKYASPFLTSDMHARMMAYARNFDGLAPMSDSYEAAAYCSPSGSDQDDRSKHAIDIERDHGDDIEDDYGDDVEDDHGDDIEDDYGDDIAGDYGDDIEGDYGDGVDDKSEIDVRGNVHAAGSVESKSSSDFTWDGLIDADAVFNKCGR